MHGSGAPLSLIGSQQATSLAGTESALRTLLRYLHGDMNTLLSIPSEQYMNLSCAYWSEIGVLHAFSDAFHAPYRFGRRSITGGAIFVEGSLIETVAKQRGFLRVRQNSMLCSQCLKKRLLWRHSACECTMDCKRPMMTTRDLPLWSRTQKVPSP